MMQSFFGQPQALWQRTEAINGATAGLTLVTGILHAPDLAHPEPSVQIRVQGRLALTPELLSELAATLQEWADELQGLEVDDDGQAVAVDPANPGGVWAIAEGMKVDVAKQLAELQARFLGVKPNA